MKFSNPTESSYQVQHNAAVDHPRTNHEHAIVALVRALDAYAHAHFEDTSDTIGQNDHVLADYFGTLAWAAIKLLTGERGRLDGGKLDGYIRELCATHAVEIEQ